MDDGIPKASDAAPVDLRSPITESRRKPSTRLGQSLKIRQRGILGHLISEECRRATRSVTLHTLDARQDVRQVEPLILHSGRASASTRSRMIGCKPPSVAMSTWHPRSSSRSAMRPPGNQGVVCGPTATSRSRSLFGPAVPRVTEPNTRTFTAPCRAAIRRISSRCARTICCANISMRDYHVGTPQRDPAGSNTHKGPQAGMSVPIHIHRRTNCRPLHRRGGHTASPARRRVKISARVDAELLAGVDTNVKRVGAAAAASTRRCASGLPASSIGRLLSNSTAPVHQRTSCVTGEQSRMQQHGTSFATATRSRRSLTPVRPEPRGHQPPRENRSMPSQSRSRPRPGAVGIGNMPSASSTNGVCTISSMYGEGVRYST
jgi:hypothetical protein